MGHANWRSLGPFFISLFAVSNNFTTSKIENQEIERVIQKNRRNIL